MAHFTSSTRFGFAVEMQLDAFDFEKFCPVGFAVIVVFVKPQVAQQVEHHTVAQR